MRHIEITAVCLSLLSPELDQKSVFSVTSCQWRQVQRQMGTQLHECLTCKNWLDFHLLDCLHPVLLLISSGDPSPKGIHFTYTTQDVFT